MPEVDYDALAQQHGGGVDYDALAAQHDAAGVQVQDSFQRLVNYDTGSKVLGAIQGVAKGAASTGETLGAIARYAMGKPQATQQERDLDTKPNRTGQGTGKFLEQLAEFLVPSSAAGKALKGAGTLAKIGAQSAIGSGVSALQTGGDPTSTVLGGVLGAAGEAIPAAVSGVKALAKDYAPTVQNFRSSMGATPIQVPSIQRAMAFLKDDGIKPTGDIESMHQAFTDKLSDLGGKYQALPPDIPSREIPAQSILQKLQSLGSKYTTNSGVVPESMKTDFSKLNGEIQTIKDIAAQQNGKVTFADLQKLRDGANDLTDWNQPKGQRNLYDAVGNAYRSAMDQIAPETTDLNKSYARYKELAGVTGKNISFGRGNVTKSMFVSGIEAAQKPAIGAGIGFAAGHATGIPFAGEAGAAAGAYLYPKLSTVAVQALQNAADSGALTRLSASARASLNLAMKAGDDGAISRILARTAVQTEQSAANK